MTTVQECTQEEWLKYWDGEGYKLWHQDEVDQTLMSHFPALLERLGGRDKRLRIIVPFCGKTLDMLWLAEAGHRVVGVDISEIAVKGFFIDNHLPYEKKRIGKLMRYRCTNAAKEIEVWQGDFFECSSDNVGIFDAAWDHDSMAAVPVKDRQRYVDLILSLLAPKGAILMHTYEYNQEERPTVPYSISGQLLQDLWGYACSLQLLETIDELQRNPIIREMYAVTRYNILAHLIQKDY